MKLLNIMVLAVLVTGLAMSGCTAPKEDTSGVDTASPTPAATLAATGDVMDSEMSTIESNIDELDTLLADLEGMQDISFTELEDLSF
ncbi:MAG: hypothetical protein P1P80_00060 [ANME-2 cluster archaeon]|nr:hypothetical protein [ANME-2 cluster archaeon]